MKVTRLGRTGLKVSRSAVTALDLDLTEREMSELEAPYQPQDYYWW